MSDAHLISIHYYVELEVESLEIECGMLNRAVRPWEHFFMMYFESDTEKDDDNWQLIYINVVLNLEYSFYDGIQIWPKSGQEWGRDLCVVSATFHMVK